MTQKVASIMEPSEQDKIDWNSPSTTTENAKSQWHSLPKLYQASSNLVNFCNLASLATALSDVVFRWLITAIIRKMFLRTQASTESDVELSGIWKILFLDDVAETHLILILGLFTIVVSVNESLMSELPAMVSSKVGRVLRTRLLHECFEAHQMSAPDGRGWVEVGASAEARIRTVELYVASVHFVRKCAIIKVVLVLFACLALSWLLTIVVVLVLAGGQFVAWMLTKYKVEKLLGEISSQLQDLGENIRDLLKMHDLVKTTNSQQSETNTISKKEDDIQKLVQSSSFWSATRTSVFVSSAVLVIPALLLTAIGQLNALAQSGSSMIGSDATTVVYVVIACIMLLDEAHKALIILERTENKVQEHSDSLQELSELFLSDFDDTISLASQDAQLPVVDHLGTKSNSCGVEVHDLCVDVERRDTVAGVVMKIRLLSHCSLSFPAGTTTALMGESGVGKSTLLKTLTGLIPIASGSIRVGSLDLGLASQNMKVLRDRMVYVSQTSTMFARSLRENICYGCREPPNDREIVEALSKVGLQAWTETLPEGLDTILTAGELNMSGGQAQRVQLARLFLKSPEVVLMDECLSALDPERRTLLVAELKKYLVQKTCIITTHHHDILKICSHTITMEAPASDDVEMEPVRVHRTSTNTEVSLENIRFSLVNDHSGRFSISSARERVASL